MRGNLIVTAFLLAACVGEAPQVPPETAGAPPAQAATPDLTRLEAPAPLAVAPSAPAEAAGWQQLAQQLEADNARLQVELAAQRAETERYRQGLERAVSELNRVAGAAAVTELQRQMAATAPPPASPRVFPLGQPNIQASPAGGWLVTGWIWNAGDRDAEGSLTVELLRDGVVVESRQQPFLAPHGVQMPYTTEFSYPAGAEGLWTARARLDVE